jgi:ribose transport system ATP-binding protein
VTIVRRGSPVYRRAINGPVVEMRDIEKAFPGVQALRGVNLAIGAAEIVGIAGENGSGKSTLMKILAGRYSLNTGRIVIAGQRVRFSSPGEALRHGIALVPQEVPVHDHLAVWENVLFGHVPKTRLRTVSRRAALAKAREALAVLDLDINPRRLVRDLPLHQRHMVSVAHVLYTNPQVLILDEPTSSLTTSQVESVFAAARSVKERGFSVVYITHRLPEYFQLCDRLVVLRDGEKVADGPISEVDEPALIRSMVGRALSSVFVRPDKSHEEAPAEAQPVVLEMRNVSTPSKLKNIDLTIRAGEIVGIAGQAGAGRSTLVRVLGGRQRYSGEILVRGEEVRIKRPADAIRAGIGSVPDDRKRSGLVLTSSVHENLTMPSWSLLSRWGIRRKAAELELVGDALARFRIRTTSTKSEVNQLSGGNQQKIVIAKWLSRVKNVLVLDEPTRGVDVATRSELYGLIDQMAARGLGILVCSSELLELIRLSDRIVVMRQGRVVGAQEGGVATEESLTAMAFSDNVVTLR